MHYIRNCIEGTEDIVVDYTEDIDYIEDIENIVAAEVADIEAVELAADYIEDIAGTADIEEYYRYFY